MASNLENLERDLAIIGVSMAINALCVYVLLQIKKVDHKLIPPPLPPQKAAEGRR
jgi:hypothetical protein